MYTVTCEDGQVRHQEPFIGLVEAATWASNVHICTRLHTVGPTPKEKCQGCGGTEEVGVWTDSCGRVEKWHEPCWERAVLDGQRDLDHGAWVAIFEGEVGTPRNVQVFKVDTNDQRQTLLDLALNSGFESVWEAAPNPKVSDARTLRFNEWKRRETQGQRPGVVS